VDPGAQPELPIGLELSAYRIVQEALTNALKHAPGSAVDVRLSRSRDRVTVEVRNGPGSEPAANISGGHGLVGVRERVSLFGGSLHTEPTTEGGYLAATFPVGSVTS
jgi:signal transduction histidine kinase